MRQKFFARTKPMAIRAWTECMAELISLWIEEHKSVRLGELTIEVRISSRCTFETLSLFSEIIVLRKSLQLPLLAIGRLFRLASPFGQVGSYSLAPSVILLVAWLPNVEVVDLFVIRRRYSCVWGSKVPIAIRPGKDDGTIGAKDGRVIEWIWGRYCR